MLDYDFIIPTSSHVITHLALKSGSKSPQTRQSTIAYLFHHGR